MTEGRAAGRRSDSESFATAVDNPCARTVVHLCCIDESMSPTESGSCKTKVTPAGGSDSVSIVQYAQQLASDYDRAFCVFDRSDWST